MAHCHTHPSLSHNVPRWNLECTHTYYHSPVPEGERLWTQSYESKSQKLNCTVTVEHLASVSFQKQQIWQCISFYYVKSQKVGRVWKIQKEQKQKNAAIDFYFIAESMNIRYNINCHSSIANVTTWTRDYSGKPLYYGKELHLQMPLNLITNHALNYMTCDDMCEALSSIAALHLPQLRDGADKCCTSFLSFRQQ